MPNKTQLMTAITVVLVLIVYKMAAPRLGLPVI